jgi:hypothetical protein
MRRKRAECSSTCNWFMRMSKTGVASHLLIGILPNLSNREEKKNSSDSFEEACPVEAPLALLQPGLPYVMRYF